MLQVGTWQVSKHRILQTRRTSRGRSTEMAKTSVKSNKGRGRPYIAAIVALIIVGALLAGTYYEATMSTTSSTSTSLPTVASFGTTSERMLTQPDFNLSISEGCFVVRQPPYYQNFTVYHLTITNRYNEQQIFIRGQLKATYLLSNRTIASIPVQNMFPTEKEEPLTQYTLEIPVSGQQSFLHGTFVSGNFTLTTWLQESNGPIVFSFSLTYHPGTYLLCIPGTY